MFFRILESRQLTFTRAFTVYRSCVVNLVVFGDKLYIVALWWTKQKSLFAARVKFESRVRFEPSSKFFFLVFFLFFLFMSWWLSLWLVLPQWRLFGILQTFSFPVRRDCEISFAGSSILTEIIPIPFYDFREWFTLVLLRNEAEATVRCFLRHFNLKLAQTKMLSWNSWVVSIQHKQK